MQPLLPCSHSFPGWDGGLLSAPAIVWHLILSDVAIAAIYFALAIGLFIYVTAKKGSPPFPEVLLSLSLLFGSCGVTHTYNVLVLFEPSFWGEAAANWMTVVFSFLTAFIWFRKYHGIINYTEATLVMRRFVQRRQEELFERLAEIERQHKEGSDLSP